MQEKYFDKYEFKQVFITWETDPIGTKEKFEKYLAKYPKDYSARVQYVNLLIVLGYFDLANKLFLKATEDFQKDEKFTSERNEKRFYDFYKHYVFCKIKLLFYNKKYQELLNYLLENYKLLIEYDIEFKSLIILCKKRLGIPTNCNRENKCYIFRQFIEYSEDDFLDHIQKYLVADSICSEESTAKFCENFPIMEVISYLKNNLNKDKALYHGLCDTMYIFKYDDCGHSDYKITNYFKVICFYGTNDIITMYPCKDVEKLPYTDLNSIIKRPEENSCIKVKRMSQIDKFNARFGRK